MVRIDMECLHLEKQCRGEGGFGSGPPGLCRVMKRGGRGSEPRAGENGGHIRLLLFDEIRDKAHPDVFNVMLQGGSLMDGWTDRRERGTGGFSRTLF